MLYEFNVDESVSDTTIFLYTFFIYFYIYVYKKVYVEYKSVTLKYLFYVQYVDFSRIDE